MTASEHRLLRHLAWVVAVKLLVLAGLWQAFVAGQHVAVDDVSAAAHLGAPAGSAPDPAGAASTAPQLQGAHP